MEFIEKPGLGVRGIYIGLISGKHEAWINPETATKETYRHETIHAFEKEAGFSFHSFVK